MQKLALWLAGGAVAALAAAGVYLALQEPEAPRSPALVQTGDMEIGGPFELTTQEGARITSGKLIDGPTLIYFGYTWCPDVCPVDTQTMVEATAMLEERGHEVTPVFITVDPARDDTETLAYFADAMHPRMVALTGSEEEIRAAADAYRVYYDRVEAGDSAAEYLMNHTAYTYFVTPEGVQGVFRNGFPPEEMARTVAAMLEAGG